MILSHKEIAAGKDIPWGWTVAYRIPWRDEIVVYPFGIHLFPLLWWSIKKLWLRLKFWRSEDDWQHGWHVGIETGKRKGYLEGFEDGKAAMLSYIDMSMKREIEKRTADKET